MGENAASKNYQNNHHLHSQHQVFDISIDVLPQNGSKCFDDDGRLKRTGGVKVSLCGLVQYIGIFGIAIGYTIASSISMMPYKLNLFRLVWRTIFVLLTTVISMLLPFFNDVVGILGALGFWPLTVYFPVEMYIAQKKIPKWSTRWICLQMLSMACLVISLVAAAGSIAGVVLDLKVYKPFKTSY
ncbi:AMINO ACID CARRIER [Salix viminalis]|uniref:AMINO ACID CARRIER n=1 Tax=Salix viminalis TaxID=40686 RepID=A0A9Q0UVP2_SALVM|nr:AMINO ACID CARRIER [Salix viminalis]